MDKLRNAKEFMQRTELQFQKKRIKDQQQQIQKQEKELLDWIEQQQDPSHNQE